MHAKKTEVVHGGGHEIVKRNAQSSKRGLDFFLPPVGKDRMYRMVEGEKKEWPQR